MPERALATVDEEGLEEEEEEEEEQEGACKGELSSITCCGTSEAMCTAAAWASCGCCPHVCCSQPDQPGVSASCSSRACNMTHAWGMLLSGSKSHLSGWMPGHAPT
jgi:hypothetical protein